jgi:hypothetical protein
MQLIKRGNNTYLIKQGNNTFGTDLVVPQPIAQLFDLDIPVYSSVSEAESFTPPYG